MLKQSYEIPTLPLDVDVESKAVLKALSTAHRYLAEVKGRAASIPNQGILIDTLTLQEAKASSEVENIVTTQDDLFKADPIMGSPDSPAAKEVARYREALKVGFQEIGTSHGNITNNTLIAMFRILKSREDGFRKLPGTALKEGGTGRVVYVPPQEFDNVQRCMANLEQYVNDPPVSELDPVIRMAIIHHQFESIHPFPDGNGRIGRILNVLYLTKMGLLDTPILYLSRHITKTKMEYYTRLQAVRDEGDWEGWILYILTAVAETSKTTLVLMTGIRDLMAEYKNTLRQKLPKIYSQDLLNNLFRHPYTRIEYIQNDLGVSRQTAAKYLDMLADAQFVTKVTQGRSNYYVNTRLINLFIQAAA